MRPPSRGILASLLVAGADGGKEEGGRSGPGKFTLTAESGGPPGGLEVVRQAIGEGVVLDGGKMG